MLLERLESGLLLFETPQGLVPVELSRWQRAYLLWTFRNFRRLSLPLLSSRQAAMICTVAQKSAKREPRFYDPTLVIGVVEGFRFPPVSVETAPIERVRVAKPALADSVGSTSGPASAEEGVLTTAPRFRLPKFEIAQNAMSKISWPRLTGFGRLPFRISWPRFADSGRALSRAATIVGVLLLCAWTVIVWHRLSTVTRSEAHGRPAGLETTPPTNVRSSVPLTSEVEVDSTPSATTPKTASPRAGNALHHPAATAIDVVRPASSIAAVDPSPKSTTRPQDSSALPKHSAPSDVWATRPPLRSIYPDYGGVEARGMVALIADVDSEGVVQSVRVIRGKSALAAPAVRAVRQWRYPRYFEDGKPIATETNIVISVFSDDAISMSFPPNIPAGR